MVVKEYTNRPILTILLSAKTVISPPPLANQRPVFSSPDQLWTNGERGQMADCIIYFYFVFMSGSNHGGVCHMVIVWEGTDPTTTIDICQIVKIVKLLVINTRY